ncbi:MAG TPA: arginine repressor [Actinomycetota bacterium]|nr:arginine repressor [Actinomycetota bacterium]
MKRQRQEALLDLVRREPLASQEEIRRRLAKLGHRATQSTISRDLEELGLVRGRGSDGRLRYLPAGNGEVHATVPLDSLLRGFATSVDASGNVVVIKTLPGTANAVASGVDRSELEDVLGTVAGDDTIMVVVRETAGGKRAARTLRDLAGLS